MRIRLEHNGTVFEFERRPMPEGRFKALCALAAAGVYAGMVWAIAALCGGWGVLMVAAVTLFVVMIASA
ncbi:MAG: hypothetical protein K2P37_08985 [Oscillospiraceae bacterium]|nr:hypothetical protein [Oscillospiraceae bacterium]